MSPVGLGKMPDHAVVLQCRAGTGTYGDDFGPPRGECFLSEGAGLCLQGTLPCSQALLLATSLPREHSLLP